MVTHGYRKPFPQIELFTTAFHWLWFGQRCTRLGPEEVMSYLRVARDSTRKKRNKSGVGEPPEETLYVYLPC